MHRISDETIDYVGILAKLELSPKEREQAKQDMGKPMSHIFPVNNVFREDVVENGDEHEKTLCNAPARKDNSFMVPKTVE